MICVDIVVVIVEFGCVGYVEVVGVKLVGYDFCVFIEQVDLWCVLYVGFVVQVYCD